VKKSFYFLNLSWQIVAILFAFTRSAHAQPAGYYNGTEDLIGVELRQALHNIIDNHNARSYSQLWSDFELTDKKLNGKVWDMYSDQPDGTPAYEYTFFSDQCGNYSGEGSCYNREHSWPKSWFGDASPMYTDLFHLIPTDGYVNGRRSNYPFGEVGSASWISTNGSKVGSNNTSGYSGTVFEPIDAYKGDLARGILYMTVRYYGEDNNWPGSAMTDGANLKDWALSLMLQWHLQDPVSQKEIDRNNAVYALQNNRNPFIDEPDFALRMYDPTAQIESRFAAQVRIFPNPVNHTANVKIQWESQLTNGSLLVTDLSGRTLMIQPVENTENHETAMDMTGFNPGFYLIHLQQNNQIIFTGKLILN